MISSQILLSGVFLSCGIAFVLRWGRREQGLPPGPPTVPLLGNAHMLGGKDLHLRISHWARQYGEIFSIKLGSNTMVVLSSATAIKEVVDKHAWVGSSRAPSYIAEICGSSGEFNILFAGDSPRLKNLRRTLARFFSPQNSRKHVPAQDAESIVLLHDLMERPEKFSNSIRRFSHSLAKIIAYGQRASSFHDPEVQKFYTSLDELIHALSPAAHPPFELLPVLKYLPPPLAPWRALGRRISAVRTSIHTQLYNSVQRRQAAGDEESKECFIGKIIQGEIPLGEEQFYSYTGLGLLDAGSDTTGAFILSLVLILAVYPECQERARNEIDAVVKGTRLPVLEDFSEMPYLNALIKEALRFRPQFPMGVPHAMAGDVIYQNYIVPKDAIVVLNTYGLFRDPELFEHPEIFNPNRFLNSEHGTLPDMDADFRDNFIFGGGRRICPGQWVARATMQLAAMRLIWAFKLSEARDVKTGAPISRDLDCYSSEFVVMPHPFKCTIEPRTPEHREIVSQALDNAKLFLSRYEVQ